VDVKAKFIELKEHINTMVTIAVFRVGSYSRGPRSGHDGKLGGQARGGPYVAGT